MKFTLTLIASAAVLTAATFAETFPFRLPDLAPPAGNDGIDRVDLGPSPDLETILSAFEEHQAELSDYGRVSLLRQAAQLFLSARPRRSFIRLGVGEAIIDLGLEAARGAENTDTVFLRWLRAKIAALTDPEAGANARHETTAALERIDPDTVRILCENDESRERERQALVDALAGNLDQWARSRGFGGGLGINPIVDVHIQMDPGHNSLTPPVGHSLSERPLNREPSDFLSDLHARNVEGFIGAAGFGIVRQLRPNPKRIYRDDYGDYWTATRSQLVSFDGREMPVAYDVTGVVQLIMSSEDPSSGPRLAGPWSLGSDDIPVRSLTPFESAALPKALELREPVIDRGGRRIDMVAPILAQKSCLRCHDAEEGKPLGAFTYVLEPDSARGGSFRARARRIEEWRSRQEPSPQTQTANR